jgi:alpha-methylacyl-CoA racemase
MMLSDMGASVIRIERINAANLRGKFDVLRRGRTIVNLDLKQPGDVAVAFKLIDRADALIEGFRPGVMEKLGLGPDVCLERNPRLVYGRMTGWGQSGPLAQAAGHDINYIALSGVLHAIGERDGAPVPPLNLVGDFGGGGMMLAFGVVCGLLEAQRSGQGQVIDAAMTDGAATLMAAIYGLKAMGIWSNERGANLLDGGAHFYGTYECADGKYIAVGSIEPQFYQLLLEQTGLPDEQPQAHSNKPRWPELKMRLAEIFKSKTRDEWCALMEGTDVCFAPVLEMDEAPRHPHNAARGTFVEHEGYIQPAPAPRFSRTAPAIQQPAALGAILHDWGLSEDAIQALKG